MKYAAVTVENEIIKRSFSLESFQLINTRLVQMYLLKNCTVPFARKLLPVFPRKWKALLEQSFLSTTKHYHGKRSITTTKKNRERTLANSTPKK